MAQRAKNSIDENLSLENFSNAQELTTVTEVEALVKSVLYAVKSIGAISDPGAIKVVRRKQTLFLARLNHISKLEFMREFLICRNFKIDVNASTGRNRMFRSPDQNIAVVLDYNEDAIRLHTDNFQLSVDSTLISF